MYKTSINDYLQQRGHVGKRPPICFFIEFHFKKVCTITYYRENYCEYYEKNPTAKPPATDVKLFSDNKKGFFMDPKNPLAIFLSKNSLPTHITIKGGVSRLSSDNSEELDAEIILGLLTNNICFNPNNGIKELNIQTTVPHHRGAPPGPPHSGSPLDITKLTNLFSTKCLSYIKELGINYLDIRGQEDLQQKLKNLYKAIASSAKRSGGLDELKLHVFFDRKLPREESEKILCDLFYGLSQYTHLKSLAIFIAENEAMEKIRDRVAIGRAIKSLEKLEDLELVLIHATHLSLKKLLTKHLLPVLPYEIKALTMNFHSRVDRSYIDDLENSEEISYKLQQQLPRFQELHFLMIEGITLPLECLMLISTLPKLKTFQYYGFNTIEYLRELPRHFNNPPMENLHFYNNENENWGDISDQEARAYDEEWKNFVRKLGPHRYGKPTLHELD